MKGIEEGKIPTEKGKLIAEKDAINNFKVPNNPRSAWQRFKKQLKQKDIYSLEESLLSFFFSSSSSMAIW